MQKNKKSGKHRQFLDAAATTEAKAIFVVISQWKIYCRHVVVV